MALLTQVALDMDSLEAIKAAIRAKAAATPPGDWVVGFLYDDTKTPRPLDRGDLDAAAPEHPVLVQHRGGHTAFVNSRALALAKITDDTARIRRMANTFATKPGVITAASRKTRRRRSSALAIKPPSRDDYRKGAALISKQFASRGITSACEADGNPAILAGLPGCARCR